MNLNYLEKVHGLPELGITHDFDTWVEGVKNNDAYLNQLHGYLKNKKGLNVDFNEWKTGVFGEAVEEPKLQEEVKKEKTEEKGEYHISEDAFKNPEKKGWQYGYEANLIVELEKITEVTGIKKAVEKITGDNDCGCGKRKEKLNKILPYKK